MGARWSWLLCLCCLGCHSLSGVQSPEKAPGPAGETSVGEALWEKGQEAMQAGQIERAIELYQLSLAQKQPAPRSHLSLAAAFVAKEDEPGACLELAQYLEESPDHAKARFYFAELLWKLGKHLKARPQFERTVAQLQQEAKTDIHHLIHCHGRLLELAEDEGDQFQAHLNRGIGLYWLARGRAEAGDPEGDLPAEGLLCKAAAELSLAQAMNRSEARPCWYLYSTWRQLAQTHQAARWLQETLAAAPFSDLTPAEQRSLQLAATHSASQ